MMMAQQRDLALDVSAVRKEMWRRFSGIPADLKPLLDPGYSALSSHVQRQ